MDDFNLFLKAMGEEVPAEVDTDEGYAPESEYEDPTTAHTEADELEAFNKLFEEDGEVSEDTEEPVEEEEAGEEEVEDSVFELLPEEKIKVGNKTYTMEELTELSRKAELIEGSVELAQTNEDLALHLRVNAGDEVIKLKAQLHKIQDAIANPANYGITKREDLAELYMLREDTTNAITLAEGKISQAKRAEELALKQKKESAIVDFIKEQRATNKTYGKNDLVGALSYAKAEYNLDVEAILASGDKAMLGMLNKIHKDHLRREETARIKEKRAAAPTSRKSERAANGRFKEKPNAAKARYDKDPSEANEFELFKSIIN